MLFNSRRREPRGRSGERGQSLVEFALLTPMIIAFIAAIVMFGLAMNTRASLQQAVREGARQLAVGKSVTDAQNLAAGNAPDRLQPADVQVCHPVNTDGSQGSVGDPVRVYIYKDGAEGYPFTLVPLGGIFNAFGVDDLVARMKPRATTRLEKSVGTPINCP